MKQYDYTHTRMDKKKKEETLSIGEDEEERAPSLHCCRGQGRTRAEHTLPGGPGLNLTHFGIRHLAPKPAHGENK